jgi:hypothetical protein
MKKTRFLSGETDIKLTSKILHFSYQNVEKYQKKLVLIGVWYFGIFVWSGNMEVFDRSLTLIPIEMHTKYISNFHIKYISNSDQFVSSGSIESGVLWDRLLVANQALLRSFWAFTPHHPHTLYFYYSLPFMPKKRIEKNETIVWGEIYSYRIFFSKRSAEEKSPCCHICSMYQKCMWYTCDSSTRVECSEKGQMVCWKIWGFWNSFSYKNSVLKTLWNSMTVAQLYGL